MKKERNEGKAFRLCRWVGLASICAAVALASSPAWSENLGQCARIEAPWPVVLPDGSTHEAGPVTLCLQQMWTPASGLHEIRINGTSIGLFMSRVGTSEQPVAGLPVVVFQRDGTEKHRLLGYAWPDGEAMRTYVLGKFGKATRETFRNARLPLLESEETAILLAVAPVK